MGETKSRETTRAARLRRILGLSGVWATLLGMSVLSSCRSLSRDVNNSLPEFLRSEPGSEEIERWERRRRVANRTQEELDRAKADFEEAKGLYDGKKWTEAAQFMAVFLENYPDTPWDQEARLYLIRAYINDDSYSDARKALLDFMAFYPVSPHSTEVEQIAYDMGMSYIRGEQDFFVFSSTGEGVKVLTELYNHYPGGVYADDAHWQIGQYYFTEEDQWVDAEKEFKLLVDNYPDSPWAARAQYNVALCRLNRVKGADYDQKLMEDTIESFEKYLADFPDGDRREEAANHIAEMKEMIAEKLFRIADWYVGQDQARGARYFLVLVIRKYPTAKVIPGAQRLLDSLPPEDAAFPFDHAASRPASQPATQPSGSGNP